jgi:hypothetical protein
MNWKRWLVPVLKYLIAFILLGYVVSQNWSNLVEAFQNPIHWTYLGFAAVIGLASITLTFVRWYVLVRALDLRFAVADALRLGFMGYFFNSFLPGSIGGDIIKAAFIAREQPHRRTAAVATVVIDRAVGLWGLFWLVTLVGGVFWLKGDMDSFADRPLRMILAVAATIIAISLLVWILLGFLPESRAARFSGRLARLPKVGGAAREFWRAIWMYREQGTAIWFGLAIALVGHVGFVSNFYFASLAIQGEARLIPSIVAHFLLVPIGMTVQAIGLTPGGLGVGELAYSKLYELVHFPGARGFLAAVMQRVVTWTLSFAGYFVYLRMRRSDPSLTGPPPALSGSE